MPAIQTVFQARSADDVAERTCEIASGNIDTEADVFVEGSQVKEAEYSFQIDVFNPETFPMKRLGEYIATLGALLGEASSVHFVGLKEGSTQILHRVDAEAVARVEQNILAASQGTGSVANLAAYRDINSKLREDNGSGRLLRMGEVPAQLLLFEGREGTAEPPPDVIVQHGFIDGVIIRLGGKDATVPVQVQDGETSYRCTTSRDVARRLGAHIFGPELRLVGEGKWLRTHSGEWSLEHFKITTFETLDERPLSDVVNELRAIPGAWGGSDAWLEIQELRNED